MGSSGGHGRKPDKRNLIGKQAAAGRIVTKGGKQGWRQMEIKGRQSIY